jgi:hypothetical protein
MGILHAIYGESSGFVVAIHSFLTIHIKGVGALTAPLSATSFAKITHWSFQYLISLGITVINTIFLIAVFRGKRQEGDASLPVINV